MEELGITESQSLSIRAMSFDNTNTQQKENIMSLNPFRSGQCLSTVEHGNDDFLPEQSQSLSIRAMSFDIVGLGSVLGDGSVSIPFDQGNVFRQMDSRLTEMDKGLNPFRSGQCLSTILRRDLKFVTGVSIPFDQGNVFRLQRYAGGRNHAAFQTHFPIFLEG